MRWSWHIQLLLILPILKASRPVPFGVLQLTDHHPFLFAEGSISITRTSYLIVINVLLKNVPLYIFEHFAIKPVLLTCLEMAHAAGELQGSHAAEHAYM